MESDKMKNETTSTWIECDLQQLQHEDIAQQLAAFFGEQDADRFVNPKLEDETPSKLNLQSGHFQKPAYQQGAHTLWNTLRSNSTKKLVHETRSLHHGYERRETAEHEGMLKHVEKYRQRVELMHKISCFNEVKTRQLVQTIKLPSISHQVDLCEGLIVISNKKKNGKSSKCVSPSISLSLGDEQPPSTAPKTIKAKEGIIRFMSEEELTEPGRFRQRLEKLGINSNIGISKPELLYRTSNKKTPSEPTLRNNKVPIRTLQSSVSDKPRIRKNDGRQSHPWQPLTLNALAQYTCSIPAPGSGEFKSGAVEMWNPEIAADIGD